MQAPGPIPLTTEPIDLLGRAPLASGAAETVAREAGFSLRVVRPSVTGAPAQPPGMGRLLLVLRGEAVVREFNDPASKVVESRRPERVDRLDTGQLFAVANDARWSLEGGAHGVVLAIRTTVPRASRRVIDLGRRGRLTSPGVVFANEALRLELRVQRGRLARSRRIRAGEYVLALRGELEVELDDRRVRLRPGSLLRVPADSRLRLRPTRWRGATMLVLSSALDLRQVERLDRTAARGFTPFERG